MKVSVTITVDVDREAWVRIYGTGETAEELRKDVKAYIGNGVQDSAAFQEGGIVEVSWK